MAIFIAIAVGFAAAGYYQAKKAQKAAKKAAEDMAGILYTKESTIESVPVIYGERRTGGTRVFVETKPYFSGDKHNKELYMAIVLSEGEVESISDIWIDDKPLSKYAQYFGSIALDLGTYAQVGGDQEIYIQKFLGTDNQAASSVLQEAPSWGANHKLSGFAYLAVRLRWNDEAFQGIPDISAVVKGRKVYDPRTSTTAYTTNAALCLRDYLLNDRFGKGLPSDSIDEAAFIQAANDIDSFTITPYVGAPTNIKLFELHAAIKTDEELFQNVEKILMSCRGFLPYRDGKYGLTIDQSSSPVMTIDSDMIIGGINIDGGKKDDRFNIVEVKFPNKQLDYNVDTAFWPDPSSSTPTSFSDGQGGYLTEAELHAQFVAEDLGHVLKDDVDLECVTNYYAARDMARIFCLRSRNDLGVKIKCTSEATDLAVGDVVAITHPTPAWTAKPFQVESVTLEDDGTVSLQLLEYASNIYAYDPANEERDYPDTELPDPFVVLPPQSVTASNVSALLEDGTLLPRMEVTWTDADDAFVEEYEIRYKLTTATTYEYVRSRTTERIVEGIKTGTYNVGVRSINSMGVKSAWEDGANIQLTKDTTKPQDIATLTATAGARQVTLSWTNPADVDYKQTRIYQNTTNSVPTAHSYVVTGDTFVVTGLEPVTNYYFWVENEDYAGNIALNKTASGVVQTLNVVPDQFNLSDGDGQVGSGQIGDSAVDTDQIADNAVDITKIADTLESTNYVAGTSGWKLTTDGTFEAGDALFRGSVTATNLDLTGSATIAGSITATSIVAGGVTYDMLSPEAVNELQNRIGNGSAGDFKTASATIPTTIILGTFTHGTKQVETTVNASKTGYHYQSYTLAQRTVNWTIEKTVAGQSNWGFVDSGSIVLNQFDLTASVPNTYYHTVNYTNHSYENDTAGDYTYRIYFSSVGSAFSDPNISVSVTLSANEESSLSIDTSDFISATATGTQSVASSLSVGGDLSVTGDLNITGNINSYNVTDLEVTDTSITLNAGGAALTADGAGLYIEKAVDASTDASITWDATNDEFDFSHPVTISHTIAGTTTSHRITPLDVLTLHAENTTQQEYDGFGQGLVFAGQTYNNSTVRPLGRILHQIADSYSDTTVGTELHFQTIDDSSEADAPTTKLSINKSGNIVATGTITASGYNNSNWDTAYTYSQVGHLPLAGGTIGGGNVANPLTISRAGATASNICIAFSEDHGTATTKYFGLGGDEFRIGDSADLGGSGKTVWHSGNLTNNSSNWNTAYTYSQVGHLPLSGGTLTGDLSLSGLLKRGAGTNNSESSVASFSGVNYQGETMALSLVNSTTASLGNAVSIGFHNANNYSPTGKIKITQEGETTTDSSMRLQVYNSGLKDTLTLEYNGDVNIHRGGLQINDTTVIDSSRNGFFDGISIGTTGTSNDIQADGKTAYIGSAIFGNAAATNTPAQPVHVKSSGSAVIRLEDSDGANQVYDLISNQGSGFTISDVTGSKTPFFINTSGETVLGYSTYVGSDNSRLRVGSSGGGKSLTIGNTITSDGTNLDYAGYIAYDSYFDGTVWRADRTNLSRKWMTQVGGYHDNTWNINYYGGDASSGWASSAWSRLFTLDASGNGTFAGAINATNIDASGELEGAYIGVSNSTQNNGYGISLYGGGVAGEPTYGLMFQGTGAFGQHGSVTGSWATYFTMNNDDSRGWIFRKAGVSNAASISAGGNANFNGTLTTGGRANFGEEIRMTAGGNIRSNSTFAFLTTSGGAQYGKFHGVSASDSYSIGSYGGYMNAKNGFMVNNTTVISSSRNLTNIGTVDTSGNIKIVKSDGRFQMDNGTGSLLMGSWDGYTHRIEGGSDRPMLITSYSSGGVNIGYAGGTTLSVRNGATYGAGLFALGSSWQEIDLGTFNFENNDPNNFIDIIFACSNYWGMVEVEITSSYSYQNACGSLIKRFAVGHNSSYSGYGGGSEEVISDTGYLSDSIRIGSVTRSGSNFVIPVNKYTTTKNTFSVRVKLFSVGYSTGCTVSLGSKYSGTNLAREYKPFRNITGKASSTSFSGGIEIAGTNVIDSGRNLNNIQNIVYDGVIYASNSSYSSYRFQGRSFSWNSAMQAPSTHKPHIFQETWSGWDPILGVKTQNGFWQFGAYTSDVLYLGYMAGAFGSHSTNSFDKSITFQKEGSITASGDITAFSDVKLKDNISTISDALDKVMSLRGVVYTRKDMEDKEKLHLGVIAQEVEKVIPEVVHYNEASDVKSVSYGNITALLIEAIKEQQNEINELKSLVKHLLEK